VLDVAFAGANDWSELRDCSPKFELVELWKGLVVLSCLVSSVEMNGKS
jgi:hypothetical protein